MASHPAPSNLHRSLLAFVALLFLTSLAGAAALWPGPLPVGGDSRAETFDATVITDGASGLQVEFDDPALPTGPVAASRAGTIDAVLETGAKVRVVAGSGGEDAWVVVDHRRLGPLAWLVGLFVVAVIAAGRWHGFRSLVGLVLSLAVVVSFVVPAVLGGSPPALVALVGAILILTTTLYLVHGVNRKTTAAVVGTAGALALTIGVGLFFIDLTAITGLASEEMRSARVLLPNFDGRGLILAGLIIAALGVLDDVTISQASTVFTLADTDPGLNRRQLFMRAMVVGRDHIASVINTLFLAYAGASLTLLVLFSTSGIPTGDLINSELIAEEIVKTVVGSLALISAVPATTLLAAALATSSRGPEESAGPLPEEG